MHPVPSELIMLLGGALAAGAVAGAHPSLVLIIVAGVAGNVAGSYVAWAVGRYGGTPLCAGGVATSGCASTTSTGPPSGSTGTGRRCSSAA